MKSKRIETAIIISLKLSGLILLQKPWIAIRICKGSKVAASILAKGLEKRDRHHVHLSSEIATAKAVGNRHRRPVVLAVDAQQMYKDSYVFYQSKNGVWLTNHVPSLYIQTTRLP